MKQNTIDCIEVDKIRGTSDLYIDYLSSFSTLKKYYAADYKAMFGNEFLRDKESKVNVYSKSIEFLKEQNTEWLQMPAYKKRVHQLKQKGAQAIVTGQQLGLLGGPLYTVYKALAAAKLAELLCSNMNSEVIPIFWLEGEDHDILEVNKACMFDMENTPVTLEIEGFSSTNRIPVGELTIGDAVEDFLNRVEEIHPESEFKKAIMHMIRDSYAPSSIWKHAFSKLFIKLLGKYGILLIDASDKKLKDLARPVFEKAITNAEEISELLHENNKSLLKDGYHLQVKHNPFSTNLFLKVNGDKYLLEIKKDGYFYLKGKNERFSKEQLLEIVENEPERFIPNVLLRPIVQDYLLPTVSYIAGPAEIAYFAQIKPLYNFFGVHMPIIFPRPSLTIIEKKIDKVVKKFAVDLIEFYNKPDNVIERIIHEEVGDEIQASFAQSEKKLDEIINELNVALLPADATLKSPLEKTASKMRYQLESLKQKTINAAKKAQQTKINQLEKLKNNLLPFGDFQERCLNITPFLIRYGLDLIDKIYNSIELDNCNHKLIYL